MDRQHQGARDPVLQQHPAWDTECGARAGSHAVAEVHPRSGEVDPLYRLAAAALRRILGVDLAGAVFSAPADEGLIPLDLEGVAGGEFLAAAAFSRFGAHGGALALRSAVTGVDDVIPCARARSGGTVAGTTGETGEHQQCADQQQLLDNLHFLLHFPYLVADRGCRNEKGVCCDAETALVGNGDEGSEVVYVQFFR